MISNVKKDDFKGLDFQSDLNSRGTNIKNTYTKVRVLPLGPTWHRKLALCRGYMYPARGRQKNERGGVSQYIGRAPGALDVDSRRGGVSHSTLVLSRQHYIKRTSILVLSKVQITVNAKPPNEKTESNIIGTGNRRGLYVYRSLAQQEESGFPATSVPVVLFVLYWVGS